MVMQISSFNSLIPTISSEGLLFWWAHQDLNLGPKDYESRHPKKTTRISRGYIASLSVCSVLCSGFNETIRSASSLFGFEIQRNFGTTVSHFIAPKFF